MNYINKFSTELITCNNQFNHKRFFCPLQTSPKIMSTLRIWRRVLLVHYQHSLCVWSQTNMKLQMLSN